MELDGRAWVGAGKGLALDVKQGHIDAAVETPTVVEPYLVFCIGIPFCGCKAARGMALQGVATSSVFVNIDVVAALRTVMVKSEGVAETQVMMRCRTVVKGGAVTDVVDGGLVVMLGIVG